MRSSRFLAWLLAISLLPCLACGGGDPISQQEATPELVPWPAPSLDNLEPSVQGQLTALRTELATLLENTEVEASRRDSGEGFVNLARHYHAYELWSAAVPCYENALELLGPSAPLQYQLGMLHLGQGALDDAVVWLKEATQEAPEQALFWTQLGGVLGQIGDREGAEAALDKSLELAATAQAHFLRGQLAAEADQSAEAIEHFQAALRLQPGASRLQLPLALAYRALGDEPAADAAAAQRGDQPVVMDDPWMAEIASLTVGARSSRERAVALLREGDYAGAEALLREALAEDPGNLTTRVNLGATLLQAGRLDEAAAMTEGVLAEDPRHPQALVNLAQLETQRGRPEEARELYRRLLDVDPRHAAARFNLANLLLREGDFPACAKAYAAAIEVQPDNPQAWLGEVVCLGQSGAVGLALRRAAEGRATLANPAPLTNAEARLLASGPDPELRDAAGALTLIRPLISGNPSLENVEALAMALAEAGNFTGAVDWQRRALVAVRQSQRRDLLAGIEANLRLYESGKPCRSPWQGAAFGANW